MAKLLNAPAGVRAVRSRAGFSVSGMYCVVEVAGADRETFLNSQLPADVAALDEGAGVFTAYLDQKGRISHDVLVLALEDRYWILTPHDLAASFLEKLEGYHIREKVELRSRGTDLSVLEVHGPAVPELLAQIGGARFFLKPYRHQAFEIDGVAVRFVADPWTGDLGGHLVVPTQFLDKVVTALRIAGEAGGLIEIGDDSLEVLRIEGGHPRFGVEMDDRTLLLELGRDGMVSLEKGCYLGQETVARVHSRGHVNRLLRGLIIEGPEVPDPGAVVHQEEAKVGEVRSAVFSPSLDCAVALAMIRTRVLPGSVVHVQAGGGLVAARVVAPPLYEPPGPAEQAETLYRQGIESFMGDRFEEALGFFERATLMNPERFDAFESMGVCYERMGQLDLAEETMQSLTEMDPENVMAWTNLSRYYAKRGQIDEAEKVKGHVTFLVWKRQAGEKAAERREHEEEEARVARLTERVDLFKRVLDLDPEDVVANFGLAKVYHDLERHADAVPHFRRAIENQQHYSMAYNLLGTSLARLGRIEEARRAFEEGIEAAVQKGDFIPKQDMTRKLDELGARPSGTSENEGK